MNCCNNKREMNRKEQREVHSQIKQMILRRGVNVAMPVSPIIYYHFLLSPLSVSISAIYIPLLSYHFPFIVAMPSSSTILVLYHWCFHGLMLYVQLFPFISTVCNIRSSLYSTVVVFSPAGTPQIFIWSLMCCRYICSVFSRLGLISQLVCCNPSPL